MLYILYYTHIGHSIMPWTKKWGSATLNEDDLTQDSDYPIIHDRLHDLRIVREQVMSHLSRYLEEKETISLTIESFLSTRLQLQDFIAAETSTLASSTRVSLDKAAATTATASTAKGAGEAVGHTELKDASEGVQTTRTTAPTEVVGAEVQSSNIYDHSRCRDCSQSQSLAIDCLDHIASLESQTLETSQCLALLVEARERLRDFVEPNQPDPTEKTRSSLYSHILGGAYSVDNTLLSSRDDHHHRDAPDHSTTTATGISPRPNTNLNDSTPIPPPSSSSPRAPSKYLFQSSKSVKSLSSYLASAYNEVQSQSSKLISTSASRLSNSAGSSSSNGITNGSISSGTSSSSTLQAPSSTKSDSPAAEAATAIKRYNSYDDTHTHSSNNNLHTNSIHTSDQNILRSHSQDSHPFSTLLKSTGSATGGDDGLGDKTAGHAGHDHAKALGSTPTLGTSPSSVISNANGTRNTHEIITFN